MRKGQTSRSLSTKQQLVNDYRARLRNNVKAIGDHLTKIALAVKIPTDDYSLKANSTALMADHCTLAHEVSTRAALISRSADELLKLTNEIREFLILRDFNFIGYAVTQAEKNIEQENKQMKSVYDKYRVDLAAAHMELDKELLSENFGLRY